MLLSIVRADADRRRFMTAPGVRVVVAMTYKTAMDDPGCRSLFWPDTKEVSVRRRGLDRADQQGGDAMVRTALALKAWGLRIAELRGLEAGRVAAARKLAVVHRMWVDGSDFRWSRAAG